MITRSTLNTRYTPKDVYYFARDGNADKLIIAWNQGDIEVILVIQHVIMLL